MAKQSVTARLEQLRASLTANETDTGTEKVFHNRSSVIYGCAGSLQNNYELYSTILKVCSTPQLKNLQNHVTPNYAAHWRVIGTQLGLPSGTLDIIEQDHVYRSVPSVL